MKPDDLGVLRVPWGAGFRWYLVRGFPQSPWSALKYNWYSKKEDAVEAAHKLLNRG